MDGLALTFEADRPRLVTMATRLLGSRTEADDAVQEGWLRLSRSDADSIDNLSGWLTTVVSRVCLDMLRQRATRREESLDVVHASPVSTEALDPEQQALLADTVGSALLVVLDTLSPAERLAFVLHDMFAVPFEDIATVLGRSPAATRQLASRARRQIQGARPDAEADRVRRRQVVGAFLASSRNGDFAALVELLAPDVVLGADATSAAMGAADGLRGAAVVAESFAGRARAARPALIDGEPGLVWTLRGEVKVVFAFRINEGAVVEIELLADPDYLAAVVVDFSRSG